MEIALAFSHVRMEIVPWNLLAPEQQISCSHENCSMFLHVFCSKCCRSATPIWTCHWRREIFTSLLAKDHEFSTGMPSIISCHVSVPMWCVIINILHRAIYGDSIPRTNYKAAAIVPPLGAFDTVKRCVALVRWSDFVSWWASCRTHGLVISTQKYYYDSQWKLYISLGGTPKRHISVCRRLCYL